MDGLLMTIYANLRPPRSISVTFVMRIIALPGKEVDFISSTDFFSKGTTADKDRTRHNYKTLL